MRNRILVAAVGTPILLVVLLALPPIYTPVFIAVLTAIAAFEMSRALGVMQIRLRLYAMAFAAAIPLWVYFGQSQLPALCALLLCVILLFLEAMASKYQIDAARAAGVLFCTIFTAYFLSALVRIGLNPLRSFYILVPIITPFLSDAFAMFSGMLFGKHKLAPEISPKKTVEGSIGGLLGGIIGLALYGLIISQCFGIQVQYHYLLVYGLVGSLVAQLGDLSFSYIKRQNGIKDFGTIFPGHGGVLDRFDSVIFCAPTIEILILLLPVFSRI